MIYLYFGRKTKVRFGTMVVIEDSIPFEAVSTNTLGETVDAKLRILFALRAK